MILEVGKPCPAIAGRGEGTIFSLDDSGALLIYAFDAPTAKEIAATKHGQPFQIKFLELDGVIWVMTKCGDLRWADAPYNPRVNKDISFPIISANESLALTLVMADSITTVVKSLRLIGLGNEFSAALVETARRVREYPMTAQQTAAAIQRVMSGYRTSDLVRMASQRWKV